MSTTNIYPQSDSSVNCSPSSGSNHAALVSDSSDYTYNYRSGSGSAVQDILNINNPLPSGAVINSVNLKFRCATESNGAEYARPFVKLGANTTWGTNRGSGTSIATFTDTGIARPGGGSWTRADFDSLLIGYELKGDYHPDGGKEDPPCDTYSSAYEVYLEISWTSTLSQDPTYVNFGQVAAGSTPETGLTYLTVTNNSGYTIDIQISGTDMTGGVGWTLDDDCDPDQNTFGLKAGLDGASEPYYTIVVKKTSPYNFLVESLESSESQDWGLKLYAPTSFTDSVTKTGTITLTGIAS